ncbi:uncharacterized protein LOC124491455 [Dermatophagoides farinae]|uniref:uncharacterized protein LOC124491455 n=1 Tax=Dermatophagoides farinae TaxID=6954 RepID=UPI001F0D7659|nr:uncharacterized protein LOC124491455 [Dermatophagoides farinae]
MMENSTITTINNNVIIAETTTDLITIDEMEKPDSLLGIYIFLTLVIFIIILLIFSIICNRASKTTTPLKQISAMEEHWQLRQFVIDDHDDDNDDEQQQDIEEIISETSAIHFMGAPCSTQNGGIIKCSKSKCQHMMNIKNERQKRQKQNSKHVSFVRKPKVIIVYNDENPCPTNNSQIETRKSSLTNNSNMKNLTDNDVFGDVGNQKRLESIIDGNIIEEIDNLMECSYNRISSYLKCQEELKQLAQDLSDNDDDDDEKSRSSIINVPNGYDGIYRNFDI